MAGLNPTSYVLKHQPEDFLVRENVIVPLQDGASGQRYLVLHKKGFTTMEAIRWIADHYGLSTKDIGYAGLKDEDGVTEQLVSVPADAVTGQTLATVNDGSARVLRLDHHGYGHESLTVGGLNGNSFRVVLRDLDPTTASTLTSRGRINLLFVNYYDTQRFGVPGGPRRTHHLGVAILHGDWASARRELIGLRSPESDAAAAWEGADEAFFEELDPRTVAFYLSAHSSATWNDAIRDVVDQVCGANVTEMVVDGLPYLFPTTDAAAAAVQGRCHELAYTRFAYRHGPVRHEIRRPTVVQAQVTVQDLGPDPEHQGSMAVGATFQLPSGCYATTALRQLVLRAGQQGQG